MGVPTDTFEKWFLDLCLEYNQWNCSQPLDMFSIEELKEIWSEGISAKDYVEEDMSFTD